MYFAPSRSLAVLLSLLTFAPGLASQTPRSNEPPRRDTGGPARQSAAQSAVPPTQGFQVNPAGREESRVFFNTIHQASKSVPIGWTGNTAQGIPGTTAEAFREAVALRVNYFRAMAGVPAGIAFSEIYSGKDQRAALMMSANNNLSHNPPPSWRFYSAAGAEAAANSNLYLGDYGPRAIDGYMDDFGSGNKAAGHRRWILYPQTATMGTGDVPQSGAYLSANALWVIDENLRGTRPATRESFVAWPPPGYVPYPLAYSRWSFSMPGANFNSATVSMRRNGTNIPVTLEPLESGYGEDTLVWFPNDADPNNPSRPDAPASDLPVSISIGNVALGGATRSFDYTVTLFDPLKPGADTVVPALTGPSTVYAGVGASHSFNAVPRATGYQWQHSRIEAWSGVEGAENGSGAFVISAPADYEIISTSVRATGAASFHLTLPGFLIQSIAFRSHFIPQTGGELRFNSRLGWATAAQTARVQVSTDDGIQWQTLWSQPGTRTAGERAFTSRTVSLSAFAGRMILVRFLYDYHFGDAAYDQTSDGVGWYIDDIAFVNTDYPGGTEVSEIQSSLDFTFNAPEPGTFLLAVRPIFYEKYPGEWGPLRTITATLPPSDYPAITGQPADVTAPAGSPASFHVTATASSGTLTYQWLKNGDPIDGATSSTFTIQAVGNSDAADYSAIIKRDNANAVTSASARLTVTAPAATGGYHGLLLASPRSHASTGRIAIAVTRAGSFTARIIMRGVSNSFRGIFDQEGVARFGRAQVAVATLRRPAPLPPLMVQLTLDPSNWRITGTVAVENQFTAALSADRVLFTTAENPALPLRRFPAESIGAYHIQFSVNPGGETLPSAVTGGPATIFATGTCRISGRLPEGTPFTYGGVISKDFALPVYLPLYGARGSAAGMLQVTPANGGSISGALTWFRPRMPVPARFRAGWPSGCNLEVTGSR
jgi:uncharacterized protein YkwD